VSHPTKHHLLEAGLAMLLEQGYNDLGIQPLLQETGVPKGSFYHHFASKEDFALQVVDLYMERVHEALWACAQDSSRAPLDRVRGFFEMTKGQYRQDGYLGCMLGGLGQELSGVNDAFRQKIEACFTEIGRILAGCLEEARHQGDLPPDADSEAMASLLIDCWEGAALRSRLKRNPAPLDAMLDFYFGRIGGGVPS
jgi:TetR/AcrR family transcriptional regulator, transcriptional repressor for nem operon